MTNDMDTVLKRAEQGLAEVFTVLEERCHRHTERVLQAFLQHRLSESHFMSVTGYGHNDTGREVTDAIFATVFQAEAALVRLQLVSGTHAIACALRGVLQPGDMLLSVTGQPYDTLEEVIGLRGTSQFSLIQQGVHYQQIDCLHQNGLRLDLTAQEVAWVQQAKAVFIQRSRGYNMTRPSLAVADIEQIIMTLRAINPQLVVVVDNCYGEFVDDCEPTAIGADLIAGSLIKNPGGGLVPTGGYIAGRRHWVSQAAEAFTAPGIGANGGYTFEATRQILQGLYFAPSVVKDALKGMRLAAAVFQEQGFKVHPTVQQPQTDTIQVLELGTPQALLAFCQTLQSVSPVDAHLTPEPDVTPGYSDPVVMAGGTFIFGSTIELSADAPMRPPYCVFLQGGLTYSHVRYALKQILSKLCVEALAAPLKG